MLIPKKKNLRIVDVGCSDGYVINSLKGECVGVDCSRSRLTDLNDNVIKVRANVEHLPFQNEYFNVVICTDVFEHVENESKLSHELHRILKPNGMLLFACPWEQDLSVYELEEFKKKYKLYKCRHIRSVDNKMIKKNFKNFKKINETMIISVRKFMEFTPYSIKFIQFLKE